MAAGMASCAEGGVCRSPLARREECILARRTYGIRRYRNRTGVGEDSHEQINSDKPTRKPCPGS